MARETSNSANAIKALVIPHPGHETPVSNLKGQKTGMISPIASFDTPNTWIVKDAISHKSKITELKLKYSLYP